MGRARTHRTFAAVAAAALLLAACGGGGSESGSGSGSGSASGTTAEASETGGAEATSPPVELEGEVNAHGSATVSGESLEVELDDFYFEPTYIQGEPGQTVELELHNEGSASHTFTIDEQSVDEELGAGDSTTVEVTIPQSGSVRFYCRFHAGQGMQGALVASG